jgi:hypothetical protein
MMTNLTHIKNSTKRQPYAGMSVVCSAEGLVWSTLGFINGRPEQNQASLDSRYIRQ